METQEKLIITVNKWKTYQVRNDLKTMAWFRVESNLPEHPAFFELNSNGKWFFIFILCMCAKKSTDTLETTLKYLEHYSKVSSKEIIEILRILHEFELIRYEFVTGSERIRSLHNITEHNTTEHNNTKQDKNKQNVVLFDFDLVWQKYPDKVGSKKAKDCFNRTVKTEQDFKNIQLALENYLNSERVKKGFIQNGSTWFNNWQDWVEFKEKTINKKQVDVEASINFLENLK